MKNIITTLAIVSITVVTLFTTMYIECHYTKEGIVTDIQDSIITIEDSKGQQWEIVGKSFELDQKVTMIMHTNHTDSRQDDIVKEVK